MLVYSMLVIVPCMLSADEAFQAAEGAMLSASDAAEDAQELMPCWMLHRQTHIFGIQVFAECVSSRNLHRQAKICKLHVL